MLSNWLHPSQRKLEELAKVDPAKGRLFKGERRSGRFRSHRRTRRGATRGVSAVKLRATESRNTPIWCTVLSLFNVLVPALEQPVLERGLLQGSARVNNQVPRASNSAVSSLETLGGPGAQRGAVLRRALQVTKQPLHGSAAALMLLQRKPQQEPQQHTPPQLLPQPRTAATHAQARPCGHHARPPRSHARLGQAGLGQARRAGKHTPHGTHALFGGHLQVRPHLLCCEVVEHMVPNRLLHKYPSNLL